MDALVKEFVGDLNFGQLQIHKNMGVLPLFTSKTSGPNYITLQQALEKNLLHVTEVNEHGSVPELKVVNEADQPVLILDGEELMGAKQNRIVNISILLKKKSQTIIPVSCTEQGRWSYVSPEFKYSEIIAAQQIRSKKVESVSCYLKMTGEFRSDQSAVWEEVAHLSKQAGVHSETMAMRDVFESRQKDLQNFTERFSSYPGQQGLLVFINGEVIGFDMISQPKAYKILHNKLMKSYAMEALLQKNGKSRKPSVKKAKVFIEKILQCKEQKYKSIGHGWDYRFNGDDLVGSCLIYRKRIIHSAFFKTNKTTENERMAGIKLRTRFRE